VSIQVRLTAEKLEAVLASLCNILAIWILLARLLMDTQSHAISERLQAKYTHYKK
jgi:hypothetical protein